MSGAGGASFRLPPGGRARVRREWLHRLDPHLASYSDLLDRPPAAQGRPLRSARRRALEALEGYRFALSVKLAGRVAELVEAGLPDATGAVVDCVLIPLAQAADREVPGELRSLVRGLRLD